MLVVTGRQTTLLHGGPLLQIQYDPDGHRQAVIHADALSSGLGTRSRGLCSVPRTESGAGRQPVISYGPIGTSVSNDQRVTAVASLSRISEAMDPGMVMFFMKANLPASSK